MGCFQATPALTDGDEHDECLGATASLRGPSTLFLAPSPRQKRHLLQDQLLSTPKLDFLKQYLVWKKKNGEGEGVSYLLEEMGTW